MARQRDPRRDQAFEIYKQHEGNISNRAIAEQIGSPEKTVGGWKSKDKWDSKLKGESNGVLQSNERSTPKKKRSTPNKGGAPPGNQNAKGNHGGAPEGNQNAVGHGPPLRNDNAVTHGFFRKYFPEEIQSLIEDVQQIEPLEMLWISIKTKFTAIIHSQQVMFVKDRDDETKVIKKQKGYFAEGTEGEPDEFRAEEIELEYQHAWDKQATFLNAQSRAMSELRGLIKDYMTLSGEDDHRRLQLAQMEQNMQIQQEKLQVEKERLEVYRQQNAPSKANEATENWVDSLHQIAVHRRKQKEGVCNE